jgi:hypothetical protein
MATFHYCQLATRVGEIGHTVQPAHPRALSCYANIPVTPASVWAIVALDSLIVEARFCSAEFSSFDVLSQRIWTAW